MAPVNKTEPQERVSIFSRVTKVPSALDNLYLRIRNHFEQQPLPSLSTKHQDHLHPLEKDEPPLPLPSLRELVAGTNDVCWFLETG